MEVTERRWMADVACRVDLQRVRLSLILPWEASTSTNPGYLKLRLSQEPHMAQVAAEDEANHIVDPGHRRPG